MLAVAQLSAQRGFQRLAIEPMVHPQPGYYLFAPNAHDSIGLMDHSGEVVIKFRTGPVGNPRVDSANVLSHFVVLGSDNARFGAFILRDGNQQPFDTILPIGDPNVDFHEGRIWSDTSFLLLATRHVPVDLSAVIEGGNPNGRAIECVIQEVTFDGRLVFEWNSLEHIPVDQASDENDLRQELVDYLHVNAVERDADGHLLISCRNSDEIVKVHRLTGKVIWRLGGSASKGNQFKFLNDTTAGFVGFSHQHSVFRARRGTLMLFDNGNLKPPPVSSRAVEYEIDEVNMTARRVWMHEPQPNTFAPTMGSVAELPNGNILIGYGTGSGLFGGKSPVVAEEIRRNGVVDAQLRISGSENVSAYRVSKVLYGMTGVDLSVDRPGIYTGNVGDSSTNVRVIADRVERPTSIVVEKHYYRPHKATFTGDVPCTILPYRWIVRAEDSTAVSGKLQLEANGLSFLDPTDELQLYWRPAEGKGPFRNLNEATFSSSRPRWDVPVIRSGEYVIASTACIQPRPLSPIAGVVVDGARPTFRISSAARSDAYEVEVSRDRDFRTSSIILRDVDTHVETSDSLPAGVMHYWRARRVRTPQVGPWSATESFSIRATSPVQLFPVTYSGADTALLPWGASLSWRPFPSATAYRVRIGSSFLQPAVIDTIVGDTMFVPRLPLAPSSRYEWSVAAITAGVSTEASRTVFGTPPSVPRVLHPEPSIHVFRDAALRVEVRPVAGADSLVVEVQNSTGRTRYARRRIESRRLDLLDLPANEVLRVVVVAYGRYGQSSSSPRRVQLVQRGQIVKPELVQPLTGDFIRVGSSVTFEWQPVSGAKSFHLQATTDPAFDRPFLDTIVSGTMFSARLPADESLLQWRVQGRSDGAAGIWSDTSYVTLRSDTPAELLPVLPFHGRLAVPTSGLFRVTPTTNPVPVTILYSTHPYLDVDVASVECSSFEAEYRNLEANTRYFWRAVGDLKGELKPIGPIGVFTTESITTVPRDSERVTESVWYDDNAQLIRMSSAQQAKRLVRVVDLRGAELPVRHIDAHTLAPQGWLSGGQAGSIPEVVFVQLEHISTGLISACPLIIR